MDENGKKLTPENEERALNEEELEQTAGGMPRNEVKGTLRCKDCDATFSRYADYAEHRKMHETFG